MFGHARGVLAAFLGCVLIFWLVFSLYELPGEAVLYAALLSAVWLAALSLLGRLLLFAASGQPAAAKGERRA